MTTFLAILTGGGLAALGGLLSGWITNWLGDKRDQRKYAHERDMAAEARRHERLEQAYMELLNYLSRHWDWARSVRPFWGQPPTPEPLPREERWRIEALVTAYGSEEVRRLLKDWGERAAKIENADTTIRMVEKSRNASQQMEDEAREEHIAISSYKDAMWKADEAIRERVRQELAGRSNGSPLDPPSQ
jgi:hypothetical protein